MKTNRAEQAEFLYDTLRLRTRPIGVKFLAEDTFPVKTKRPLDSLGKKVTLCQGVTMARLYGWTVGLTKKDLICVAAGVAFGLAEVSHPEGFISKYFCNVDFSPAEQTARKETAFMTFLEKGEFKGLLLSPLAKMPVDPDTIAIYGNPGQIMRIIQAWVYEDGERVSGNYGGKIECTEYLISAWRTGKARISIPGHGDRIFSMTQDDELVFSLPGNGLDKLISGLNNAGKRLGARYPVTFYQNYQPEYPPYIKALGREIGIADE